MVAEFLKMPKSLILPTLEKIEDEEVKKVFEEYNRVFNELVTAVYSDVSWLYERLTVKEGTWTMGVSFGGGTTGITYSANTGYYTKIGNIVTISGLLTLTSKGSSTGAALITGLPFTSVNNVAGYAAVALWLNVITFANQYQGMVSPNTTTISLHEITEVGAYTNLTNADFANTSEIIVNCTYRIK